MSDATAFVQADKLASASSTAMQADSVTLALAYVVLPAVLAWVLLFRSASEPAAEPPAPVPVALKPQPVPPPPEASSPAPPAPAPAPELEDRPISPIAEPEPPPSPPPSLRSGEATSSTDSDLILTAADLALARRLRADWRVSPSDCADALEICNTEVARAWRRPSEGSCDVYEIEFTLNVELETFIAMQYCIDTWDENTKVLETLSTSGPAHLCHVHGRDADIAALYYLVAMPFPLRSREYVLERRMTLLSDDAGSSSGSGRGSGPAAYCLVDDIYDKEASWSLRPHAASRSNRVTGYRQVSMMWPGDRPGVTHARRLYLEDPMMPLPSWLLRWFFAKALPKGVAALQSAAATYEQKHGKPKSP